MQTGGGGGCGGGVDCGVSSFPSDRLEIKKSHHLCHVTIVGERHPHLERLQGVAGGLGWKGHWALLTEGVDCGGPGSSSLSPGLQT
jgi:hypothetical protein